jgi:DNA-binding SARP family transcriptional activator
MTLPRITSGILGSVRSETPGIVHYKLLGAFEVAGSRDCTPAAPKLRSVLALLLLQANRVVHLDTLIDELWGPDPPKSAVTIVQTYIYHLRKIFVAEQLDPVAQRLIATRQPGYLFHTKPEQVDADIFDRLVRHGRDSMEDGHPRPAAASLGQALAMWTGPALANVPQGELLHAHAVHLEERRINALELRIEVDISLGRQRQLIPELSSLVYTHPLNEWFHGQLIAALSNAGRRGEALLAYQTLRKLLSEELGVDPSTALQLLQRQVLAPGKARTTGHQLVSSNGYGLGRIGVGHLEALATTSHTRILRADTGRA